MENRIECVVDHKCILGEGPVWDHRLQRIVWLDIIAGHIHQYTPDTSTFLTFPVREMIGSIAPAEKNFIAAMESGFSFVNLDNQTI
jgi:sugar lactone lactonase YvrE